MFFAWKRAKILRTCAFCTNRSQGLIFFDPRQYFATFLCIFMYYITFYYSFFKTRILLKIKH